MAIHEKYKSHTVDKSFKPFFGIKGNMMKVENDNEMNKGFSIEVGRTENIDNQKEIKTVNFGNPFSFRGRSGRLDYLVYGVLLAYTLMISGIIVSTKLENIIILYVLFIVGGIIALASTIRRARDVKENIVLLFILALIPYVGFLVLLFLLLAPGKRGEKPIEVENEVDEFKK